jgi:hypothetical protein
LKAGAGSTGSVTGTTLSWVAAVIDPGVGGGTGQYVKRKADVAIDYVVGIDAFGAAGWVAGFAGVEGDVDGACGVGY